MKYVRILLALTLLSQLPDAVCAADIETDAATSRARPYGAASKHKKKAVPGAGPLYLARPDVMQQTDAIAQELQLDRSWVRHAIGHARYLSSVARAITPPAPGVAKNWTAYRDRFVEPQRIAAGVRFWQANTDALQRAQERFGVPPSIIVGILGVESFYGRQTGNYRIIDALCTLTFDFPQSHPRASSRSAYFRSELLAYLALTARTHTDPLALRGSYAGAMGWPQFMPSSWTRYAIDFDGNGQVDLFNNQADMIGSVANYFQAFHWQPGLPTYFPVELKTSDENRAALLAPDIVPSFSAAELTLRGAVLAEDARHYAGPLALVELQNGDAPAQYIAATENFYTITRYNWSAYYAMAVITLGDAIAQVRDQQRVAADNMPK